MHRSFIFAILFLASIATIFATTNALTATAKGKKSYDIESFMHAVKDDGLHTKVIKGEATRKENKLFAAYVKAMPNNKPPKGTAESWAALTSALLQATTNHQNGTEGSGEALAAAMDCKACHSNHKVYPPKK
jgi:cytochrome c556